MTSSKFLNPKNDVAFRRTFGSEKYEEEVEKIVDPGIKEAYEAINAFNWSEDEKAIYDKRVKDEMDCICEMEAAEERGVEKGKAETARNMLSMGLSIDIISSATGLLQQTIEGLK